jgi:hypothetical protein
MSTLLGGVVTLSPLAQWFLIKKLTGRDRKSKKEQLLTFYEKFGEYIGNVKKLEVLNFFKIRLGEGFLKSLSKGFACNTSLKEVGFIGCQLTAEEMRTLAPGLGALVSMNVLNLSQNGLKSDVIGPLNSIINTQGQRKDEIVWAASLRGELPKEDLTTKGLFEINLSQNNLNSSFLVNLCSTLHHDIWIRVRRHILGGNDWGFKNRASI